MVTVVRIATREVRPRVKSYSFGVHFDRFVELVGTRGAAVPLDEALAIICHFADPAVQPSQVLSELDRIAEKMVSSSAKDAMTELFGGFGREFYQAYQSVCPLDQGYSVRKILYNLYHILNHLNLCGSAYLSQSQNMIEKLLAEV